MLFDEFRSCGFSEGHDKNRSDYPNRTCNSLAFFTNSKTRRRTSSLLPVTLIAAFSIAFCTSDPLLGNWYQPEKFSPEQACGTEFFKAFIDRTDEDIVVLLVFKEHEFEELKLRYRSACNFARGSG